MANKTVENPCTGTATTGEEQIIKGKTYARCSTCDKLVSVNKANRKARKHTGTEPAPLWNVFEGVELVGGTDADNQTTTAAYAQ